MTCKDICKLVYSERREKKTSSPSSDEAQPVSC